MYWVGSTKDSRKSLVPPNIWFHNNNTFPWRIKAKSKCEAMSSELGQQFRIKNKVAVTLNFKLIAAFLFIPYV